MYGEYILCGISKVSFEITHKISSPYIERRVFHLDIKIQELLDLKSCEHFQNAPLLHPLLSWSYWDWDKIAANVADDSFRLNFL